MNVSITLPRLIGTRDAANRLLDLQDVGRDLSYSDVRIVARNLSTSTFSFTDELLVQLAARHARKILVEAPTGEFREQVLHAAREHNLSNVTLV